MYIFAIAKYHGPAHTASSELLTSKSYLRFVIVSTRERGCSLQVETAHQKILTWSEIFAKTISG